MNACNQTLMLVMSELDFYRIRFLIFTEGHIFVFLFYKCACMYIYIYIYIYIQPEFQKCWDIFFFE